MQRGLGAHTDRLSIGILFLTALSTLLLEITLTRVLSVVMWYHFTFAVISVSLLGIAAGAMQCHRRGDAPQADEAAHWGAVARTLHLFALAILLPVVVMLVWLETPTMSLRGFLLLLVYFVSCAAPFAASGYVTAAIFRAGARRVSSLYAADLIGGSLGCLLAIPALDLIGGIGSLLAISFALDVTATVLTWRCAARPPTRSFVTTVAVGTLLAVQVQSGAIDLQTVKLSGRERLRDILEVKWNSYSRLAMLDYFDPREPAVFPFLAWGLSDRYAGWLPRQYLITIDGASETPLTELGPDLRAHEYVAWDVTSLPYHLRPTAKTLIIGAGGGRDVLTALWFGSTDVTGVELNHDIVEWVRGKYADFAGRLYAHPAVRIVVDDGRNFVRRTGERFDVLQISMIDTFAATAAGAYTLSENNLYTAEAFDEYLAHLMPGGLLSINRFFLDPPQQTLRIVTLAREALERRGIADPSGHVVVVRKDSPLGNNGLVMIKTSPFSPDDLATVVRVSSEAGFEMVVVPGRPASNPFTDYLAAPSPARFYDAYPFDVRPPRDDRPFFFNTLKLSAVGQALGLRRSMDAMRVYNFDAVFILVVLAGAAVISLLLFLFLPLLRAGASQQVRARETVEMLPYFVWVGLGFILVEVVWIQRFHLYLGHPVYSLAVILVSILASAGLGSAWTTRCRDRDLGRWLAWASAAIAVLAVAYEGLWRPFLDATLGLPLAVRIGLTVASLLPLGLCLGMPYPLGLRAAALVRADRVPWVWAVNASASVLGSILAFTLAMGIGFRGVLLVGAACYLGALASARTLRGSVIATTTVGPDRLHDAS